LRHEEKQREFVLRVDETRRVVRRGDNIFRYSYLSRRRFLIPATRLSLSSPSWNSSLFSDNPRDMYRVMRMQRCNFLI